ncbi:RICIN domain-containing protein [Streptomyces sp. BE20]|uniref:RICIN domain-containing protein n=1 Tax=Streptomyces sp. BE20 TaxID=3002525 RepID=UPI002E796748|nr:RICIN domain-containing protein [Streptomyces sp. BE20]MEE1820868.1 RICIN domain-containing protein [Streptomyces sp. BE20]
MAPRTKKARHRTARTCLAAAVVAAGAGLLAPPQPAAAAEPTAHLTVRLDPGYQQQPFQGWGTTLGWFANVTGGWPDERRNQLADELFGADGLGLTVARYNIGGGDSPETVPYMRAGAAVPGHWNRPAEFAPQPGGANGGVEPADWWNPNDPNHWNAAADANQRWWLAAAKSRGADTFEAFSNSAPYFMTVSGLVSGAVNSWENNLRPDQYDRFAAYLAGSIKRVQASTGVTFDSVSPVNEPGTGYWRAGGPQEGSHWDHAAQARMIDSMRGALDAAGLATPVAAMDETDPVMFRDDWNSYPAATRSAIGRLNVHTYGTQGRIGARDVAKGAGKPLWMSEVDLGGSGPQNFTDMAPALDLSRRITGDLTLLEPRAWVLWQAVEDYENMTPAHENANWGLIQVDLTPDDPAAEPVRKNKKYWAMANYTRFVRPGARIIGTNSAHSLAALRPGGEGTVVVHTNTTGTAQALTLDLAGYQKPGFGTAVQRYTTDGTRNVQRGADLTVTAAATVTTTVGPGSVTTFVLPGAVGVNASTATTPTGGARQLLNENSGLALAAGPNAQAGPVQRTSNPADPGQQWTFTKVGGGWDSTATYRITNAATGKALAVTAGALGSAAPGNAAAQLWMRSTAGDGRGTFVNKATGLLLDVSDAAGWDGAPVNVWPPTTGSNQSWSVRSADADVWAPVTVRRSGLCAEVAGGAGAPGAAVVQSGCTGSSAQQWSLRAGSPGQVSVVVRHSGQCLDVEGESTADGARVVQYGCSGAWNQEWSVRPTGGGFSALVARHSGKCLAVESSSASPGTALVQAPCGSGAGQRFRIG